MLKKFHGHTLLTVGTISFLLISFILALSIHHLPKMALGWMVTGLALSIIFSFISLKEFVTGFLVALLTMMIGWRIAGLYDIYPVAYLLLPAFILMACNFIYCAAINLKKPESFLHRLSLGEWQLVFIRLYLGLNFVPHFTEKLFAGPLPHQQDVTAFIKLGVPYPDLFVWLAGFCELNAAIALGLGFLIRLGSFGTVLYLALATLLGHHFSLGFIWAGEGGGWEFATLWMVLICSFMVTGFNGFSMDQQISFKVSGDQA